MTTGPTIFDKRSSQVALSIFLLTRLPNRAVRLSANFKAWFMFCTYQVLESVYCLVQSAAERVCSSHNDISSTCH